MASTLHRRLREATRQVVFASPVLRAEYRRRHRWWWVGYLALAALVLFLLALFIPLVWPLLDADTRAEMFRRPIGASAARDAITFCRPMLVVSSVAALMVLLLAPMLRNYIWCGGVSVRAYWPLTDAELTRGGWIKSGGLGLSVFLAAAVWGWCLSLMQPLSDGAWVQLMLLAALHAWLVTALTWYATAQVPQRWLPWCMGAVIAMLSIGFPTASLTWELVQPFPRLAQHAELLSYLLPTGWVCGAIDYAVLRAEPLGWLFLLPVALVTLWAWRWRQRGLGIAEFVVSNDGACLPIFSRGFRGDLPVIIDSRTVVARAQLPSEPVTAAATIMVSPAAPEQVTKRILSGAMWESFKWPSDGFVERWVGSLLTAREQRVLIYLRGGRPYWTYAWRLSWWLCLPALLVERALAYCLWYGNRGTDSFVAAIIAMLLMLGLAEILTFSRPMTGSSLQPLFPIQLPEALWAVAKTSLIRVPLGLLPLVCVAMVSLLINSASQSHALRLLIVAAVVAPGMSLAFTCASNVTGVSERCFRPILLPLLILNFCLSIAMTLAGFGFAIVAWQDWSMTRTALVCYGTGMIVQLGLALGCDRWAKWDFSDRLPHTRHRQQ